MQIFYDDDGQCSWAQLVLGGTWASFPSPIANLRPPSGQNLESNCGDSTPIQGLDGDITQKVLKNISQFHLRNQEKKNWFSNKPFLTMAINSFMSINFSYGRRKIPPPSYSKFCPKFKGNHEFTTNEGCKAQIPLEWVAHMHCSPSPPKNLNPNPQLKNFKWLFFFLLKSKLYKWYCRKVLSNGTKFAVND